MAQKNLHVAKQQKNDEFYTQLSDIANELRHYREQLRGKVILCNCDDPFESNFFKYFAANFNTLGLKKLIATGYTKSPITGSQLSLLDIEGLKPEGEEPYVVEINEVPDLNHDGAISLDDVEHLLKHDKNAATSLNGDAIYPAGDFRSAECIELLGRADIVVTNPPFSLFREFVAQLVEHEKHFLIIGSKNAITYKDMDGQQRTISICQYVTDIIPIKFDDGHELAFNNLTSDQQQQILDYELSIYICEGTPSEKLAWFHTINIAGKPLNDQELLNAMHTGPWLFDAKRWFSKTGGAAAKLGDRYVSGTPNRQEILERTLKWISNGNIEHYMATHQADVNAAELWQYFQEVITWVERIFPNYRSIMKGLEWGALYNAHKNDTLNAADLERRIIELIKDDEVDSKRGIYEYLLTGDERTLSLRTFDEKTRVKKYEEQAGICPTCELHFDIGDMEADHITPWSQGGKTEYINCQLLCRDDNRRKSNK